MPTTIEYTRPQHNWLGRLNWIVIIAFFLLACHWAREEDLTWLAFVVAAAVFSAVAAVRWPYGGLLLLMATSAMPRFYIEVFGWKARPEHFATAIVCLFVGVWILWNGRKVQLDKLDYWVLSFVGVNFVSSAFSSSPSETLRWALLANLAVLPYFVIRVLVQDQESLRKSFDIFLLAGLAESLYGIACYLSNHVFGTSTGMEVEAYYGNVAAPYGSMFEPNLFGAYAACTAVAFLALYLGQVQRRRLYLTCFGIASIAVLLSFSRAALFAMIVAVAWVFWKSHRSRTRGRTERRKLIVGFATILLVGAIGTGEVLRERLSSLFANGLADETAITRFIMVEEALQEFPSHPLLGSGTASMQLSFDWSKYAPSWAGNDVWIGNVTVRILHDTGIIGFAIFLGFVISLWRAVSRQLLHQSTYLSMLLALSAGALLYAITFQATDGTTLAFSWVHLGLLSSAAIGLKRAVPSLNPLHKGTNPATT